MIRYCFGVNPYQLSDDDFVQLGSESIYILDFRRQQLEEAIAKTLSEIIPHLTRL